MKTSEVVILWRGWKLLQEKSCSVASWERNRWVEHQNEKYQNLTDGPSPSSCSPHAVQTGWDTLLDWRGSSSFSVWNCSSIWCRKRVNVRHRAGVTWWCCGLGYHHCYSSTAVLVQHLSARQNQHLQFLSLLVWMYLKGSWRHPAVLRWKYLWTDNKDLRPQQRGECQLYKSISESSSKTAFPSCGI